MVEMFSASESKIRFVKEKIHYLKRQAWLPITQRGDGKQTASKFSGVPWIAPNDHPPKCLKHDLPMELLLQLNFQELPARLEHRFGSGICQVFYCEDCSIESSDGVLLTVEKATARVVKPKSEAVAAIEPVREDRLVEPRQIVGWAEVDDYPGEPELCQVAFSNDEFEFLLSGLSNQEIGHLLGGAKDYYDKYPQKRFYVLERFLNQASLRPSLARSKLGGWHQGWFKFPNCPVCQQPMDQLIFYVTPECFNSDDCGLDSSGYVLQCPRHKEEVIYVNSHDVLYDKPWILILGASHLDT